jgi:hypothetical protein
VKLPFSADFAMPIPRHRGQPCAKAGKIDAPSAENADFVLIKTRPYLIARLRADIERIVEFLLENKPAISWAEAGWSFSVRCHRTCPKDVASAAWPFAARAQQAAGPMIGFLHPGRRDSFAALLFAFQQGSVGVSQSSRWRRVTIFPRCTLRAP